MSDGDNRPSDVTEAIFDRLTRRTFVASGVTLGGGGILASASTRGAPGEGRNRSAGSGRGPRTAAELLLVNGEIHTMDAERTVVSSVAIRDGRFVSVGNAQRARGPETQVIDLDGRTVTPGILDNHNHIVVMGLRPGYHTPIENATSVGDVLARIQARRDEVPADNFITTIGGFHPSQFEEDRLPTLTELDSAVDDRPVYLQVGFLGPARTNSQGKAFFEDRDIPVAADGSIAANEPSGEALNALRSERTAEDERRGTQDALRYAQSLGVTTHLDQGAFPLTGTPADGAAHADPYSMHEPLLSLARAGDLDSRIQLNFLNLETDPDVPNLQARLDNAFRLFGSDMLNTGGIGEFTAGEFDELIVDGEPSEAWKNGTDLVAERGWRNENHSLTPTDFQPIIDYWETVDDEYGIDGLRWVLAHANHITEEYIEKLDAFGGGLSLTGYQYLDGGQGAGPPFRTILDSDIRVGMSSDSAQIAPLNPWLHMYYAVTGKNANGDLINDGEQITREDVLHLYTAANAWFFNDDRLGSIEVDNHADLVVLNDDYFSVPAEGIKDINSVLTIVDGDIVHDAGIV